MAKNRNPRKPGKVKHSHYSQKQEKPHSWAAVRSLFTCKYLHGQQHQHQEQQLQQKQKQEEEFPKQKKIIRQQKQKQKLNQNQLEEQTINSSHNKFKKQMKEEGKKEQTLEETNKKCKKTKCSGSLCSNTKVMQKPEIPSPEQHKKRATNLLMGSSSESDASNRSMKSSITLNDLNANSSSSSSFTVPSASPSISGSFRNMPFRKLSGCYECRMVVDPVLGMTRDPSLRSTICSCPECGEIFFMKPENFTR